MCSVNLKQNELDTYNDFLNDFYYDSQTLNFVRVHRNMYKRKSKFPLVAVTVARPLILTYLWENGVMGYKSYLHTRQNVFKK